jgi:hypothetical protein
MNNLASQNIGTSAVPVETREITQQLGCVSMQLDLLDQSLHHLIERLAPVLRSAGPKEDGKNVRPIHESPLGESLAQIADRISTSQAFVGDMLQRLELD